MLRNRAWRALATGVAALALVALAFGEPSFASSAPPGYVKVFEDQFDGSELNTDHWTFGLRDPDTGDLIPGAQGDHLLNASYDGYATEEDAYIEDGALILRSQKRPYVGTSPPGNYQYTTGWVMSMHKVFFNKGYIEFRAKFPRGDKVWPALWLIPERLAWPPEWDLWEYFGFRSDVGHDIMGTHLATGLCCQNVIWYDNWLHEYDAAYGNEQWHVYGFEWTEEGARWWIDGELVHSLDASGVSVYPDEDFYIVMNNGTRTESPDTNTEWPNHLVVDYVEIYELSDEEPPEDTTPPVTSHELDPAEPAPSSAYDGPVEVTLSATDPVGDGESSGVERTEYRINTDGATGDWVFSENGDDADPFGTAFTVEGEGEHVVEFRSIDVAGNVEEVRTVAFEISEDAGDSQLALQVEPWLVKVGSRKKLAKLRMQVINISDIASGPLSLCARARQRKLVVKGKACASRPSVDYYGQTAERLVKLRVKPKARGKTTKVTVSVHGPDVASMRATARVKAKR